jgi:HTH-type transcriptional regulator/antitoxin HigA
MDIKPIKTEADYDRALAVINNLWGAELDTPEGDRLDILMALVEAYETRHHSIDFPDPVDAILFRMEQQGLTRKDLEPILGSRSRVSEILNRKRKLTLEMIRRLHKRFNIPLESLVGSS